MAKKYLEAAQYIRDLIGSQFSAGDQLPPENELAETLGISIMTLRRGVDLLVREGLINRGQGRRSVVTELGKDGSQIGMRRKVGIFVTYNCDFYCEEAGLIQCRLSESGYRASISYLNSIDQDVLADELNEMLHCDQYDGAVIIAPGGYKKLSPVCERWGKPRIYFRPWQSIPDNYVAVDCSSGAYVALIHLQQIGCQNIGYIGARFTDSTWKRYHGVRRFFKEHFPAENLDEHVYQAMGTVADGYSAMKKHLSEVNSERPRFDGIMAHNDLCAIGIIMAAREAGLELPRDLAIVGFDNSPQCCETNPALTSVNQPREQIAEEILGFFNRQLESEPQPVLSQVLLQPYLIIRDSTSGFIKRNENYSSSPHLLQQA